MTRTRIPASDDSTPVVKDYLVSSPPSSSPSQSSTVPFTGDASVSPVRKNRNRLLQYKQLHHPRQHQHQREEIITPCRHTSLVDDIESPSEETTMATTTATATAAASSPQRASSAASTAVSPKLSPISHASSTPRQQEHRQQDQREPASSFQKSQFRTPHKQRVDNVGKVSPSNNLNGSHSVASHSLSQNEAQHPESGAQQDVNASTTNVADDDDDDDFVDLSDLFLMLQRREWENVYAFLELHPTSSRQTIHSKKGITPLLHIVLRHGPPLPVVDMLLTHQAMLLTHQATTTAGEIWKQTDTNGRLPLHAACSCGPDACLDVITRLISADPDALRIRTKDQHGRYPLHLAVVTNASEDVVMELMIHSPDVSFQPDAHGKLPIEYAQDSCYGHNRLVVALEMAPMFLAVSQAAYKRVGKATETKLESLREAHASYEEQLEDRYNSEKIVLVKEQIECSNELTIEKERNIALAETMIEMKKSETDLIGERDVLKAKLDREILKRKTRTKVRGDELKKILLGKKENSDESRKGENKNENGNQKKTTISEGKKLPGGVGGDDDHSSSSNLPSPRLLKWVSAGYENSKRRNELYKKKLEKQRVATRDLNVLLATKEAELQQAHRKTRSDAIRLQAAMNRAEDLAEKHESVLAIFSTAREEAERLKKIESEREQKLAYTERRLRIQEKRLSGVQDLIASLKAAKAKDAERLDLIQEEAEKMNSGCDESRSNRNDGHYDRSHAISTASPFAMLQKDAELSVDLSVEIEMAVMAAAHLDDGSVCTSPSERRRQADLSMELAAATTAIDEYTVVKGVCSDREKSSPELQPLNRSGTNWDINKVKKWISVTPQTLSITTGTTASCGEYGFCDHALDRSLPETPQIPEEVKNGSRQEYDQFSPLGMPQLEFTED